MTVSLGSIIWTSFKPMLKIYATIGVGFFFGKQNIFDIATSRNVSYINRRILLPCLMFSTIVTNIQYTDIKQIAITCFNSFLYMVIAGILITAFVMVGLPLALPGYKSNSKTKTRVRTSVVVKSLQGWKYGMIFLMMFSNGPNLLIAYLQSLLYNTKVFSSDQINKGIGVVFLAFACFDFAVYCLGGYTMIGLDFKRGTAISSSPLSEHKSTSGTNSGNTTTRNSSSSASSSSSSTDNNEHRLKMKENESSKNSNGASNSNVQQQQQQDSDEVESISSSITSVDEVEPQPFQNNDAEEPQRQHSHISHGGGSGISSGIATATGNATGLQRIVSTASQGSQQQRLRAIELRQLPSQNINDMVNEFSSAAHPEESIPDNNELASDSNSGTKLAVAKLKRWWCLKFCKGKEIRSTNVNMIYTEDAQAIPNYHRPHSNLNPNSNIKSNINDNSTNSHSNITQPTSQHTVSRFSFFTYHIFLKNLLKPTILAPLLSFGIAMIPWLKTLFVAAPLSNTSVSSALIDTRINNAPDEYPPLNIFMSYCSYLGSAQVPISLFLWGATLSRLDFLHYTDNKKGALTAPVTKSSGSGNSSDKDMDNDNDGKKADSDSLSTTSRLKETIFSFKRLFLHRNTITNTTNNININNNSSSSNSTWQLLLIFTFISLTKLCILPIIGIAWLSGIKSNSRWFNPQLEESNSIFIFVLCCVWAMPSFNPHIYLTAYFTKPKPSDVPGMAQACSSGKSNAEPIDYLQLNCLSCCLFIQYAIFFISLPFISSFVLKHVLHI